MNAHDQLAPNPWPRLLQRVEAIVVSPLLFFVLGAALGIGGLVNSEEAYDFNDIARARALWFTVTSAALLLGAAILGARRRSAGS